jgi:hypothetical protein
LEEFTAAREQFNVLVRLQSEEMSRMEHGQVEATIAQEGNELLRRLLQGHLDLRAKTEERRLEVVGADGVLRRHCRAGKRELMSLFGEVEVKRLGYGTLVSGVCVHSMPSSTCRRISIPMACAVE